MAIDGRRERSGSAGIPAAGDGGASNVHVRHASI
jgi:hypothetical protein